VSTTGCYAAQLVAGTLSSYDLVSGCELAFSEEPEQMRIVTTVTLALLTILASGCLPKMTAEELGSFSPDRPEQLDKLDMLLGTWETAGEVRMAILDEVVHTTGTNEAKWSLDRRMLIDQAKLDMGPLGKLTGFTVWTWDDAIGKYRMWWFDSMGEFSEGIVTYDEKRQLWKIRTTGSKYGYSTSGTGTIRRMDDDTLEWTWREGDGWGFITFADMRGVSHRRKQN